jgi:hypothetical protein
LTAEIKGCRGALHTRHNTKQLRDSCKVQSSAVLTSIKDKGGAAADTVPSGPRRGTAKHRKNGRRQRRRMLHKAGGGKGSGRYSYRKRAVARQAAVTQK